MSNNSNPNYFRLGLFVLAAIGVLIAVILIFGSGQLFKRSFTIETYIKQSVTGLDTGAAVRFRGVAIGQVTSIGLSGDIYEKDLPIENRREYVVVRMQIFGDKIEDSALETFIKDNLRARVKSMGITGVNYIEFDFVNSASLVPPLAYSWKPTYPVIPSLPNQTDEIISGIQKLISSLNEMNIDQTEKKFDALLGNLNVLLAGDAKNNSGVITAVRDLNVLLDRIAKVTDKGELDVLMRELVGTMVTLRQTLASVQGDTSVTMENLRQTSEQLNEFSRIASQSPSSLIWSSPPPRIMLPMNGTEDASGAQK
ncbi:ABC-type transporter Mla subunit MlaD [Polynucleobacter sphagniphilus]|jgi:phospholipid/cholesterol/gamma-HCH transport system substrate-binding protein/paraquat-inducible protein B|uniref:MlaD family protein n=1 Tax=Polynucleobacter sphagniphilus TaxID=1743169 RepID=UPI002406E25E|nr:MlaD family protein [Polynucleobacter sphagniphilus]MDF9788091.1 ABC-type transporter Mla subunit MlaD [Polynucleobacter sphagniphilus]MDH6155754.1 ABC-type transporter Mla subunit MlaD [Polynucleobacter sphagniphilus]MDH6242217.1 ABC-type transporter Mla subunit MlaD [Polynucleobacter sphagniphilus]MDH6249894.1 ABC-type transporter Mla subunit MlaD [Polynucleobacter sphagniphilus]MDH6420092.1 ABC-type transporter Mla subunit MlaD [Polynucleobacter sphagniphilus]